MSKVNFSGIDYIDTLLLARVKWGTGGARQGANITYNFRSTFTDEQKEQLRTGLDAWEEIANIEFEAVKDSKDPGQIRFDWINDGAQARPRRNDNGIISVEVDIGRGSPYKQKGSFGYSLILLHEIGHALGLKHPHNNEDGPAADLVIDTTAYSVMSYRSYVGHSINPQSYTQNFFPTTQIPHFN